MFFTSQARTRCVAPCPVCDEREGEFSATPVTGGRRRRVYLHIGFDKTGTTALQRALEINRAALIEQGFTYPRPGREHNHRDVAHSLTVVHAPESVVEEARRIREEMVSAPADVIVSSEGFVHVDPVALKYWCGDAEVIIIVYLREQADAIASQYQQEVKARLQSESFEPFACSMTIDYNEFLKPWADVFGRENLRVRAYGERDVVLDFFDVIRVDPTGFEIAEGDPNPSIAGALLEAKRRLNAVFPGTADELVGQSWGYLVELAREYPNYRGRVGARSDFVEAIRTRHSASNAALADAYGVHLPRRPWTVPKFTEEDVSTAFDQLVRYNPKLADFRDASFPGPVEAAYRRWRAIESGAVTSHSLYQEAIRASGQRSVMAPEKLQHLFLLIRDELGALDSQDIVEFGCYRGGSALFMGYLLKELFPHARLYALDTFEGMPATDRGLDAHGVGDFGNADLDGFRARKAELGLDNIVILQGLVQETFPQIDNASFGLAHIDVDIYSACKFAQDAVWPALVRGGWLIYDDANAPSCIGATRAAEEMVMARRIHSEQVWPHWVFRRAGP